MKYQIFKTLTLHNIVEVGVVDAIVVVFVAVVVDDDGDDDTAFKSRGWRKNFFVTILDLTFCSSNKLKPPL